MWAFFWTGTTLAFFHLIGKSPCFIQDWNIKSSGLQIDLPYSFYIRMRNMLWPWALLGSRFWINVSISSLVNATVEIDLCVFSEILDGSSLELFIIEHCLAKKQLNNSAFFLKSVTHLFWWKRGDMQGIFCCLTTISILTSSFLH